jgi:outer membrane murein-binding lipoprotein Lpp
LYLLLLSIGGHVVLWHCCSLLTNLQMGTIERLKAKIATEEEKLDGITAKMKDAPDDNARANLKEEASVRVQYLEVLQKQLAGELLVSCTLALPETLRLPLQTQYCMNMFCCADAEATQAEKGGSHVVDALHPCTTLWHACP